MNITNFIIILFIINVVISIVITFIITIDNKQKFSKYDKLINNIKHNCNIETFKPYNEDYNDGIDIKTVKCSNVLCDKAFTMSAPLTFHQTTSKDSTPNDKNITMKLTTDGSINANNITANTLLKTKDIDITNNISVPTKENILINKVKLFDLIYPVGSIYTSTNPTSPASLFGGTWEQIKDRFLYSASSGSTDIGGASTVTLDIKNIPSHNHTFSGALMEGTMFNVNNGGFIRADTGYCTGVFKKDGQKHAWPLRHSEQWSFGGSYNFKFEATPSGSISNTGENTIIQQERQQRNHFQLCHHIIKCIVGEERNKQHICFITSFILLMYFINVSIYVMNNCFITSSLYTSYLS